MKNAIKRILEELSQYNPAVKPSDSGSVYIYFEGSKVKCLRVANHNGRNLKSGTWELRSDAMSSRKNPKNRIYNINSVNQLLRDFK